MTKRNKKNNKSKKGKTKGQPKVRVSLPMLSHNSKIMDHAHKLCAISNPFCPAAKGAKLFDSDTTPSITYRVSQLIPITTDSNGYQAIMVSSTPHLAYYKATTITAGTVAVWDAGNDNSFYSQLSNNVGYWRPVSAGVRIKTTQAWTSATGFFAITEINNQSTAQLPDCGALTYGLRAEMQPVRDCDVSMIFRPLGRAPETYQSMSSGGLVTTGLLLTTSGATASTTIGEVELVVNYEYLPTPVSGFQQFTSQAGHNIPNVMNARANVLAEMPQIIKGAGSPADDRNWMAKAADALNSIAGVAVPAMGAYNSMTPETKSLVLGGGRMAGRLLMM